MRTTRSTGVMKINLDLRQKIDHVLSATVQLGVAFLTTKAFDLGHGQTRHTTLSQCFAHLFEFEWFDNGCDLLHGLSPWGSMKRPVLRRETCWL
jgi:hypothetical protein